MTKRVVPLFLSLIIAISVPTYAQSIKKQVLFGVSTTVNRDDVGSSTAFGPAFSLAIPVSSRIFIRPVIGISHINPVAENRQSFATIQTIGLVGYKVTNFFSLLGGAGHVFTYKENQPVSRSNAVVVSTSTVVSDHMIVFTPVAINDKTITTNFQLGWFW